MAITLQIGYRLKKATMMINLNQYEKQHAIEAIGNSGNVSMLLSAIDETIETTETVSFNDFLKHRLSHYYCAYLKNVTWHMRSDISSCVAQTEGYCLPRANESYIGAFERARNEFLSSIKNAKKNIITLLSDQDTPSTP